MGYQSMQYPTDALNRFISIAIPRAPLQVLLIGLPKIRAARPALRHQGPIEITQAFPMAWYQMVRIFEHIP